MEFLYTIINCCQTKEGDPVAFKMTPTKGQAVARRFCATMEVVCWMVFAAAAAYVVFEAYTLWGAMHGSRSGVSVGVSVSTQGPRSTASSSTTKMIGGSVITAISLLSSIFAAVAVWKARAFFGGLARGEVFEQRTLSALRGFAIATLIMQLQPVLNTVVAMTLLSGFHVSFITTLWMTAAQLLSPGSAPNIILLGLLVAMVAVLRRATEVAEDHAAIV